MEHTPTKHNLQLPDDKKIERMPYPPPLDQEYTTRICSSSIAVCPIAGGIQINNLCKSDVHSLRLSLMLFSSIRLLNMRTQRSEKG
jgi:hypothetical protein